MWTILKHSAWAKSTGPSHTACGSGFKSSYQPINPEPESYIFHYKSTFIDEIFRLFSFLQITTFVGALLIFVNEVNTEWAALGQNSRLVLASILVLYASILIVETGLAFFQHKSIQEGRASWLGRWMALSLMSTGLQVALLYFAPTLDLTWGWNEGGSPRDLLLDYQTPLTVLWRLKTITFILGYKIYRYLRIEVQEEGEGHQGGSRRGFLPKF